MIYVLIIMICEFFLLFFFCLLTYVCEVITHCERPCCPD